MDAVQTLARSAPSELSDARASLDTMLIALVRGHGSDLHLTAGAPPTIRVDGTLRILPDYDPLRPVDTATLLRSVLSGEQWSQFEREHGPSPGSD